jgi:hypothetical protein
VRIRPVLKERVELLVPPAWYPDPSGSFERRWWSGRYWTAFTDGTTAAHPGRSTLDLDEVHVMFDSVVPAGHSDRPHRWRIHKLDGEQLGVVEGPARWTRAASIAPEAWCFDGTGEIFTMSPTRRGLLHELVVRTRGDTVGTITVRGGLGRRSLSYVMQPVPGGRTARLDIRRGSTRAVLIDGTGVKLALVRIRCLVEEQRDDGFSTGAPWGQTTMSLRFMPTRPAHDVHVLALATIVRATADVERLAQFRAELDSSFDKVSEVID